MQQPRPASKPRRYIPRFAGEAFAHYGSLPEGPAYRRLVSEVAWKQPPSAKVRAEISR